MNKLLNIGQWTLGVFFGLMALTGLLSFSLYGVGIFVCFVIATAFTIPPILAKIRAARKKQGKEISTNFAVLGAGFFAICGIVFMVNSGENFDTSIDTSKAQAYHVIDNQYFSMNNSSFESNIFTDIIDRETSAHTVIKALLDIKKLNPQLHFIRVQLYQNSKKQGNRRAFATWADGGNYHTQGWDIATTDVKGRLLKYKLTND